MKLWTVVALALLGIIAASEVSSAEAVDAGVDSDCDCDDAEALYYKLVRQYINANKEVSEEDDDEAGEESAKIEESGLKRFRKDFKIRQVCGSDLKFYNSRCHLQCTRARASKPNLQQTKRWRCRRKAQVARAKENKSESAPMERMTHTKVCICPRHYFPLCASNGITYGNLCTFGCARDNLEPGLTIVKEGKCSDDDRTFLQ